MKAKVTLIKARVKEARLGLTVNDLYGWIRMKQNQNRLSDLRMATGTAALEGIDYAAVKVIYFCEN
ncbi:MAG TPA: hypothetical protein P5511_08975 [Candidatus Goldiibacteriota bacterium]|nr:hypothetical protein [Candidatus Goldiibacteriota bacterium]